MICINIKPLHKVSSEMVDFNNTMLLYRWDTHMRPLKLFNVLDTRWSSMDASERISYIYICIFVRGWNISRYLANSGAWPPWYTTHNYTGYSSNYEIHFVPDLQCFPVVRNPTKIFHILHDHYTGTKGTVQCEESMTTVRIYITWMNW